MGRDVLMMLSDGIIDDGGFCLVMIPNHIKQLLPIIIVIEVLEWLLMIDDDKADDDLWWQWRWW